MCVSSQYLRQSMVSGSQGSRARSSSERRAHNSRVCLVWKMNRSPATKGMKRSQVISSGASCRSTLSSAWSARANRAVPTGAPHFRPRSAINLRSPRAAARNIGVLEARYSSFEAG